MQREHCCGAFQPQGTPGPALLSAPARHRKRPLLPRLPRARTLLRLRHKLLADGVHLGQLGHVHHACLGLAEVGAESGGSGCRARALMWRAGRGQAWGARRGAGAGSEGLGQAGRHASEVQAWHGMLRSRTVVGEVEAQALGLHNRPLLAHVVPQHLAARSAAGREAVQMLSGRAGARCGSGLHGSGTPRGSPPLARPRPAGALPGAAAERPHGRPRPSFAAPCAARSSARG